MAIDRPYLDFSDASKEAPSATRLRVAEPVLPAIPLRGADHAEALRCVATAYKIGVDELVSSSRYKSISEARCVAYWLLRTQTRMSYPEIGRALCKDHTSAMSGVRRCLRMREESREFEAFTDRLVEAVVARSEDGRVG